MARETKAQRLEREEAERQQLVGVAKSTYTDRMMAVFERARKMNFELEVKEAKFVVTDRDDRHDSVYVLPVWTEFADNGLWELEYKVSDKEAAAAERERLYNLRQTALAKLTDEERKALSL